MREEEKCVTTHVVCKTRLDKEGGASRCCRCVPHKDCDLMREEEKEIDRKLYEILGYEKCSEADQAIEKIKELFSSQLKEVEDKVEKFGEGIGCEKNPRWVLSEVKKIIGETNK